MNGLREKGKANHVVAKKVEQDIKIVVNTPPARQ